MAVFGAGILLARSGADGCGSELCVGPSSNLVIIVAALVSMVFVFAGLDVARAKVRSRARDYD